MSNIPIATRYRAGLFGPGDIARLDSAVQRPGLGRLDASVSTGVSGSLFLNLDRDSMFEVTLTGDTAITLAGLAGGTDRALALIRLEEGGLFDTTWTVENSGTFKWDNHFPPDFSSSWSIRNALYSRRSFSVAGQELNPQAIDFNTTGTRMFVLGSTSDSVFQYTLATAWDITTATYGGVSFSIATQEPIPRTVKFGDAGRKMYVAGTTNSTVYEYDLATAFSVSTAVVSASSLSVLAQEPIPQDIAFSSDGTRLYVVGASATVLQFVLATPWVVSSATLDATFSVATEESNPEALTFKGDGLRMYVSGPAGSVHQYNLATAWDVTTATLIASFSTASEDADGVGLIFRADGRRMFVLGNTNDTIYEYMLPVADHLTLKQIGFSTVIARLEMREFTT